jgi:hypothetical protein
MAIRKKKMTKRLTRKVAASATASKVFPVASDVWMEIGPIWMERNPRDLEEIVVRESHVRRIGSKTQRKKKG